MRALRTSVLLLVLLGSAASGQWLLIRRTGTPSAPVAPASDWYLDFGYVGTESGSSSQPYNTYEEVAAAATDGDSVTWRDDTTTLLTFTFDDEVNTYKSGISVLPEGTKGTDWDEEIWWSDAAQDDHKVIYLGAETLIGLFHNARNKRQGDGSADILNLGPAGGGDIRYYLDRDYQVHHLWALYGGEPRYPAYTVPFALGDLTYGTGFTDDTSSVSVAGATGDNGVTLTNANRDDYYAYGQSDAFGDEWHALHFADDDQDIQEALGNDTVEEWASDGKVVYLVVDPNTPCLAWQTTGAGQFYTTPAKVYYVPKIHAQTTYISPTGVTFRLSNVTTTATCYYKWDGAPSYSTYSSPVDCSALTDGTHTLYYYYDAAVVKSRTVVMDPCFPSADETHGWALWEDAAKFSAIEALCLGGSSIHADKYGQLEDRVANSAYDTYAGQGQREDWGSGPLDNAFLAKVSGYNQDDGTNHDGESAARRAKGMLLDSAMTLDDLWLTHGNGRADPATEIRIRGYYDVKQFWAAMYAYDILIADFNSLDDDEGITPVEDYKIRDVLGYWCLQAAMDLGRYERYGYETNAGGMWGAAREMPALVCATIMPDYDSVAYGVSGFGGASGHTYTPFPSQALTWKQMFFTEGLAEPGFPDVEHPFSYHEQFLTAATNRASDGQLMPAGTWFDRLGYLSISMMGLSIQLTANATRMSPYLSTFSDPYADLFYGYCNAGTLWGAKVTPDTQDYIPLLLMVNERFVADFAPGADAYLTSQGTGSSGYNTQMYYSAPYGLFFWNPDYEE